MSDEDKDNQNDNPDDNPEDNEEEKGKENAASFLKKKAAEAREKKGVEDAAALAAARKSTAEQTFGLDLEGVEDEDLRSGIKDALAKGKTAAEAAQGLAAYSMQQAARAKAFEIAADLNMLDEVEDIVALLGTATSPKELDLQAREVRLELGDKEPATKPGSKSRTEKGEKGSGSRKFDDGRGRGGNMTAELRKAINDIDPSDPDAEKQLDKLYADVQKSVQRAAQRA